MLSFGYFVCYMKGSILTGGPLSDRICIFRPFRGLSDAKTPNAAKRREMPKLRQLTSDKISIK